MNELKQALRQAVEALKYIVGTSVPKTGQQAQCWPVMRDAITAAEAALAQPEPEPVAVVDFGRAGWRKLVDALTGLPAGTALYVGSAPTQPAELVAVIAERDALRERLAASESSDAESIRMYRAARDERDHLRAAITEECMLTECVSPEGDPRDVLKRLTAWHAETGAALLRAEVARLQSALDDAQAGESVAQMAALRQPLTQDVEVTCPQGRKGM